MYLDDSQRRCFAVHMYNDLVKYATTIINDM